MNLASAQLSYRRAAVQDASPVGLVVILYDLLIDDLRRAIQAMQQGAIEGRSKHLKHGLLVLLVLESGLDMENGGSAAQNLAAFYAWVRNQVLHAQFQRDTAILQRQVDLIFDVRAAWCSAEASPKSDVVVSSEIDAARMADRLDSSETSQFFA